jgi:hypothetical protein
MMGPKKKESTLIKLYGYSHNIGVFFGAKAENGYLTPLIIQVRFNIFCRIDLFPLFIPSIPTFHYSIIPCGLPPRAATKNTIFLTSCRNSVTFLFRPREKQPEKNHLNQINYSDHSAGEGCIFQNGTLHEPPVKFIF